MGDWSRERLVTTALLVAAVPVAAMLPPLLALGGALVVTVALLASETWRYSDVRRSMRDRQIAEEQ